jgi:hypothetical protein
MIKNSLGGAIAKYYSKLYSTLAQKTDVPAARVDRRTDMGRAGCAYSSACSPKTFLIPPFVSSDGAVCADLDQTPTDRSWGRDDIDDTQTFSTGFATLLK